MLKPFISKNNPFNEDPSDGELFTYQYFMPRYWGTWIFLVLTFVIAYLPSFMRKFLGKFIGNLLYLLNHSKKHIIEINLKTTFKNINDHEIDKISKDFFYNLGQMYINLPTLWWKSDQNIQKVIKKENLHYVDKILSEDRSVILLASHTLSLDFGGRALSDYNLLSMYKPFKNKLLNWFIGRSRSKDTDRVIVYPRDSISIKKIIKKMREPTVLYLLADEDISPIDSIFTQFFDTKKTSLKSVSKLAKITNAKVLPCVCHYDVNSNIYSFKVFDEIENFPSNDIELDCAKINSTLEKQILMDKTQYMWTLRIYKHREDGKDIYKL